MSPDPSTAGSVSSSEGSGAAAADPAGDRPPSGRRPRPEPPEPLAAPTIDSHTHLDACGCVTGADVVAAMDRAAAVGVVGAVTIADDLDAARWAVGAAHADPRVWAAVALHPTRTASVSGADLAEIETLAADPRVVAIGETGLDYYWDHSPPQAQQDAFRWHIGLAKRTGKPLMIHDREAHDDVLRILREEGAPDAVIFHCFSGGVAMARECVDAGYVLSFAGPVTFKRNDELRAAAALVPPTQFLVETDAPFLTPHPHRGRAGEPYVLPWTVRGVATARGDDEGSVAEMTRRNAERIFRTGTTD